MSLCLGLARDQHDGVVRGGRAGRAGGAEARRGGGRRRREARAPAASQRRAQAARTHDRPPGRLEVPTLG